jgi:hypothetical protein
MDSIVIMDEKCIVFITFETKLKGYIWGEKQEENKTLNGNYNWKA